MPPDITNNQDPILPAKILSTENSRIIQFTVAYLRYLGDNWVFLYLFFLQFYFYSELDH